MRPALRAWIAISMGLALMAWLSLTRTAPDVSGGGDVYQSPGHGGGEPSLPDPRSFRDDRAPPGVLAGRDTPHRIAETQPMVPYSDPGDVSMMALPSLESRAGPTHAAWARNRIRMSPWSLVEIPGHFKPDAKLVAVLIESDGTSSAPIECPLLRTSVSSVAALLPTARMSRERTLRLTLSDGDQIRQTADVPLGVRASTLPSPDGEALIGEFIGPGADSLLSRSIRANTAETTNRQAGQESARKFLGEVEALLRRQFCVEDAAHGADRENRARTLKILDRMLVQARARIGRL